MELHQEIKKEKKQFYFILFCCILFRDAWNIVRGVIKKKNNFFFFLHAAAHLRENIALDIGTPFIEYS